MAMTGARTPSAIVPKEEQAGDDMMLLGGHTADGRDLGAAAGMKDTARAGEVQVARDGQPRGCGAGPRHQQHPQDQRGKRRKPPQEQPPPPLLPRSAPPRGAPEQLGAVASTGDTARAEEAQAAPERASQGLGRTQTAALRKQERSRPRRAPPPRAVPEQQEAAVDPGDAAGAEEREEPVLSDLDQRAFKMDLQRKLAAVLESEGIGKSGRKDRLIAALSQMMESIDQPAPELESSVSAVAVGCCRQRNRRMYCSGDAKYRHALGAVIRW
jgi:hypothetical protein